MFSPIEKKKPGPCGDMDRAEKLASKRKRLKSDYSILLVIAIGGLPPPGGVRPRSAHAAERHHWRLFAVQTYKRTAYGEGGRSSGMRSVP